MKLKTVSLFAALGAALLVWNILEFPDVRIDASKIDAMAVPGDVDAPQFDWTLLDKVKTDVRGGVCTLVEIPSELAELDGKLIIVSGPSFACGDDLIERADGYTIKGFIMVPYFGMIDCCVGNPIPYFQWTIIVRPLAEPWEINHKGIVDPDVVVRGRFRIEHEASREGVFFLDNAEVIDSAEDRAEISGRDGQ